VHVAKCQRQWKERHPCEHPDVQLPAGWHLNQVRIPVPSAPTDEHLLDREIGRRCRQLPSQLRNDPEYSRCEFWVAFLIVVLVTTYVMG
jgi:hypothetical protein